MITLELEQIKVGMTLEALSTTREGKRWLPARVVSKHKVLPIVGVRCYSPDGARQPMVFRRPSQLRLKQKGDACPRRTR